MKHHRTIHEWLCWFGIHQFINRRRNTAHDYPWKKCIVCGQESVFGTRVAKPAAVKDGSDVAA